MIYELSGNDLGVCHDDNHRMVEWRGDGRIVFSYAQKGKAMTAHFAAEKSALRQVKRAINEFCEWVFNEYPWCKMIMANVNARSVVRLINKCGFRPILNCSEGTILARSKWDS